MFEYDVANDVIKREDTQDIVAKRSSVGSNFYAVLQKDPNITLHTVRALSDLGFQLNNNGHVVAETMNEPSIKPSYNPSLVSEKDLMKPSSFSDTIISNDTFLNRIATKNDKDEWELDCDANASEEHLRKLIEVFHQKPGLIKSGANDIMSELGSSFRQKIDFDYDYGGLQL